VSDMVLDVASTELLMYGADAAATEESPAASITATSLCSDTTPGSDGRGTTTGCSTTSLSGVPGPAGLPMRTGGREVIRRQLPLSVLGLVGNDCSVKEGPEDEPSLITKPFSCAWHLSKERVNLHGSELKRWTLPRTRGVIRFGSVDLPLHARTRAGSTAMTGSSIPVVNHRLGLPFRHGSACELSASLGLPEELRSELFAEFIC